MDPNYHKKENFSCEICGKSFLNLGNLKRHKLIHTEGRRYKRSHCEKRFHQAGNQKRHEMVHTGESPYKCNKCGKSFPRDDHGKRHEKHCDYTESGEGTSELKKHESVHTRVQPFLIDCSEKSFNTSSNIIINERLNTLESPDKCCYLQKSCDQVGSLNIHESISAGEGHCGQKFTNSSAHIIHGNILEAVQPFICTHCRRLQRTRSEENPLVCEDCQNLFLYSNDIRNSQGKYREMHNLQNNSEISELSTCGNNKFVYSVNTAMNVKTPYSSTQIFNNIEIQQNTQFEEIKNQKYYRTRENLFKCRFCSFMSDVETDVILHGILH